MNQQIENMIEMAVALQEPRTYLLLKPASGHASRMHGKVCALEIDGVIFTFIVSDNAAVALDSRILVLDDETLAIVYNPRDHVKKMSPALQKWMERNPDLYSTPIPTDPEKLKPKRI